MGSCYTRDEFKEVEKKAVQAERKWQEAESRAQQYRQSYLEKCEKADELQMQLTSPRWIGGNAEALSTRVLATVDPLRNAIKAGDAVALRKAIEMVKPTLEEAENRAAFGSLVDIVVPFYTDAEAKMAGWSEVLSNIRAALPTEEGHDSPDRERARLSRRQAKTLFTTVRQASVIGVNLQRSDPNVVARAVAALLEFHVQQEGGVGNGLQQEIIRRVVVCAGSPEFDFTDLCSCLSFTDKEETPDNELFLQRATAFVDSHEIHEFKQTLAQLETILFFRSFMDKEDLGLTYERYLSLQADPWVSEYIQLAMSQYCPGKEMVQLAGSELQNEEDVQQVLSQLRLPQRPASPSRSMQLETPRMDWADTIDNLRSVFYWWAQIMQAKFDLLVLPHHTQVVCMLICLEFIQRRFSTLPKAGALIAEMGTGEGKSAVIASVALYCVVFLGRKVHIVVDDENLVERDFRNFEELFSKFKAKDGSPLQAHLCVSATRKESKFLKDASVVTRIHESAHIVYCEAKHIQSFYTQLAKQGGRNFDVVYRDRVLILDEVDALLIDEAPNVPFVYENPTLSKFATRVAEALQEQATPDELEAMATCAVERRVLRSMENAARVADKWALHTDYAFDDNTKRHFRVQGGRVNEGAWSLALEYKNFIDNYSSHISYQERLFVMSRPRAFRKYGSIVGLSGSVGSDVERSFLGKIYGAKFFKVPDFLTTCRNAVSYSPTPCGVFIEEDEESQTTTLCEKALRCRKKTPVLIIAADRQKATVLTHELQAVATSKGLNGKDVVRSLSRDLYENNPEKFKENLFQCTQPTDKRVAKCFRISVTDPRGGRGTDYRVTDADADRAGGLTLLVQQIPKQKRDWIQYLGRTARQGRRGQWMAVLNRRDYAEDVARFGQPLDASNAVETVLGWGVAEACKRIDVVHDEYHRGLRLNELCEQIAKHRLLTKPESSAVMVQLCNDFTTMSTKEIDELAGEITGLDPSQIPTEASAVGVDSSVHHALSRRQLGKLISGAPRSIIILIDRSSSMLTKDAASKSRFEVCRECIMTIFNKNVQDHDHLGLYTFEDAVRESFPLTEKGKNKKRLQSLISNLPEPEGLTRFYDGVSECMEHLLESPTELKFLIALTDGDDNMSEGQPDGQKVTALIKEGIPGLNLILITCGKKIKPKTVEIMESWTRVVQGHGNMGLYIPASRPDQLADAFAKVAAIIDTDGESEI
mmetsp:Transcript_41644/g.109937  ORF Transcript_41644/g.109937 Transcript_41644/m.109937 type:complete len:1214 (-) Transcript_41644:251-3892(-)